MTLAKLKDFAESDPHGPTRQLALTRTQAQEILDEVNAKLEAYDPEIFDLNGHLDQVDMRGDVRVQFARRAVL